MDKRLILPRLTQSWELEWNPPPRPVRRASWLAPGGTLSAEARIYQYYAVVQWNDLTITSITPNVFP